MHCPHLECWKVNEASNQWGENRDIFLLIVPYCWLIGSLFKPENWGGIFLRNIAKLLTRLQLFTSQETELFIVKSVWIPQTQKFITMFVWSLHRISGTVRCVWHFSWGSKRSRRSEWSLALRHETSWSRQTLGSWVRITLEAWISACVYSVCAVLCVCSGLATGWSPVQGVLPTV
jgi:hypothetical protein